MSLMEAPGKPGDLIAAWDQISPLLATVGGGHFAALREEALERFKAVGLPTRKDEEFKYTPLSELRETRWLPAYGANVYRGELEHEPITQVPAITLTFVNGMAAPELQVEGTLPNGAFLGTLEEAFEHHPDELERWLGRVNLLDGKLGSTNDERFRHLNTAHLAEGAFLFLPRGASCETLIHVLFVNRAEIGPFAAYPRLLIVLEDGATARVLESHVGLGGAYLSNAVTEIALGERSNLTHIRVQRETLEATAIGTVAVHQEAGSVYSSTNAQFGGKSGRLDLNVWVGGEHAETWLDGTYVGMGEQVVDNHTRLDHAVANCNSFEVYKGILGGKATGVFNGKIFVYEDAQKTDAKQTNQAILLSPTAQVNTKPQLEIFADDVKCTHGATVGQLRSDALFYLRARGIPLEEARGILVYAFAAEVLEKISDEPVRVALETALSEKLRDDAQGE